MQKIDAHQHFWKFDPVRDSWITEDMSRIRRDFLPQDLEPVLKAHGIDGTVVVQSDQSEAENNFQLQLAEANPFIKAVVGWVDLQAPDIHDRLSFYSQYPKLRGFRHVLQGEPQRDLMLQPAFKQGISQLANFGFTYDILIFPDQLLYAKELVASFPRQQFVVDHLAKPEIRSGRIAPWKEEMKALAQYENVSCKISGMVTEADWKQWRREDFYPYMDVVVEAFGMKRLLFGSDWPVCLVAADYASMLGIVQEYFSGFSQTEQQDFFGGNAIRFYNL